MAANRWLPLAESQQEMEALCVVDYKGLNAAQQHMTLEMYSSPVELETRLQL